jgi:hypothetical protein
MDNKEYACNAVHRKDKLIILIAVNNLTADRNGRAV